MIFKPRMGLFWLLFIVLFGVYSMEIWNDGFQEGLSVYQVAVNRGGILVLVLIIMVLAFPCKLELRDRCLYVQNGFFKKELDYSHIISVSKSMNPLASPWAWSLIRVRISYKEREGKSESFILIAPREREQFIRELSNRISK